MSKAQVVIHTLLLPITAACTLSSCELILQLTEDSGLSALAYNAFRR